MADNAFKKLATFTKSSSPTNGKAKSYFGKSEVSYEPEGSESDVTSEEDGGEKTIDFKEMMKQYQDKTEFI
jgi:hypothetical protein